MIEESQLPASLQQQLQEAEKFSSGLTSEQIDFVVNIVLKRYCNMQRQGQADDDRYVPLSAMRIPMTRIYEYGINLSDNNITLWAFLASSRFADKLELEYRPPTDERSEVLLRPKDVAYKAKSMERYDFERLAFWGVAPKGATPKYLTDLKDLVLPEQWYSGPTVGKGEKEPYPDILANYLRITVSRLLTEDPDMKKKFLITSDKKGKYCIFNTGLVNKFYQPVHCVLEENSRDKPQEWRYCKGSFCVRGVGLGALLPRDLQPARYWTDVSQLLYELPQDEPSHMPAGNFSHIICENAIRIPEHVLRKSKPAGNRFKIRNPSSFKDDNKERDSYATSLSKELENDDNWRDSVLGAFEISIKRAIDRVRWNWRTAIPIYYPAHREDSSPISLLLPIVFAGMDNAELALVVTKNNNGSYTAVTVYLMEWAYRYARVLNRPDSDWLRPDLLRRDAAGTDTETDD